MFRLKQLIGKSRIRLAALLSFLLFIGCQQRLPDAALWEGTIELAEGKLLPFRMHLDLTGKHPSGYFLVGNEKTPIPELHRRGDSLLFLFSEYGAAIRAAWDGKLLQGVYLRFRSDTTALNFRAAAEVSSGQTSHAESSTAPPVGNYQVYLQKADRIDSATVASFWTQGDSIFGTFIAPDGDYGLLAGQRFGNSVQLGRFTGWQAIMLEMNQHFGQWGGKLYSRKDSPQTFILEPRPSLSRESLGERKTAMKNPRSPFVFSGITIQGDTLSHRDPRFAGKALIVDIMGTWCHNCLDEAPLLQQIYDELKHDGLEIVGLSFEIKEDLELAKKNLTLYRERFGLGFPLLYCGTTDEANVQARLSTQLTDFFAYPTTFFIDRGGKVQYIHVGFKGPGTGEEFQLQVQEFYERARSLVGKQ